MRFYFLTKKLISVPISPKVPVSTLVPDIAEIFRQKISGDIGAPLYFTWKFDFKALPKLFMK
jgi:hypothetical protein